MQSMVIKYHAYDEDLGLDRVIARAARRCISRRQCIATTKGRLWAAFLWIDSTTGDVAGQSQCIRDK